MAALASADLLEERLGATFDVTDWMRAELALSWASDQIRTYTNQVFDQVVGDELTLHPALAAQFPAVGPQRLFLPQLPVTGVSALTVDGIALSSLTDYWWDGDTGVIRRLSGRRTWGPAPDGFSPSKVVVTYDHGFAVLPDPLVDACLELATIRFTNPADSVHESIGSYSVTYKQKVSTGSATDPIADVLAVLDNFRVLSLV